MTVNATVLRFGFPDTLVTAYRHWLVLLRPEQPTLGSLVLASTSDAGAFSLLPPEAFAELRTVIADIEAALKSAVAYEKINYLMLMMVDPHVHWHVVPRYDGVRSAEGVTVADRGWPKAPQLAESVTLEAGQIAALRDWLRAHWRLLS
jgi:diadenosine tetraphosphate (Ap4A) HIT family hydrolase